MLSQNLQRLINSHGENVTLTYKTLGTYDPSTGGVTGGSTSTSTVKAYFSNYNLNDTDGINIVYGDRQVVMGILDTSGTALVEPEVGDEISGRGDKVSIVSVQKLFSGGAVICYIAQVRE